MDVGKIFWQQLSLFVDTAKILAEPMKPVGAKNDPILLGISQLLLRTLDNSTRGNITKFVAPVHQEVAIVTRCFFHTYTSTWKKPSCARKTNFTVFSM